MPVHRQAARKKGRFNCCRRTTTRCVQVVEWVGLIENFRNSYFRSSEKKDENSSKSPLSFLPSEIFFPVLNRRPLSPKSDDRFLPVYGTVTSFTSIIGFCVFQSIFDTKFDAIF